MKEQNKPLMFIDTINTEIKGTNHQEIYDSRYHLPKKNNINGDDIVYQKLIKIVNLNKQNYQILCKLIINTKIVEGYPLIINNDELEVLVNNENKKVNINNITDIIIISV